MHRSHEFILGRKGNFGNDGTIALEFINVTSGEVCSAEDGEFGRVTDFSFTAAIDSEFAVGAEDAGRECVFDEIE